MVGGWGLSGGRGRRAEMLLWEAIAWACRLPRGQYRMTRHSRRHAVAGVVEQQDHPRQPGRTG